jgi:hypothetical protein
MDYPVFYLSLLLGLSAIAYLVAHGKEKGKNKKLENQNKTLQWENNIISLSKKQFSQRKYHFTNRENLPTDKNKYQKENSKRNNLMELSTQPTSDSNLLSPPSARVKRTISRRKREPSAIPDINTSSNVETNNTDTSTLTSPKKLEVHTDTSITHHLTSSNNISKKFPHIFLLPIEIVKKLLQPNPLAQFICLTFFPHYSRKPVVKNKNSLKFIKSNSLTLKHKSQSRPTSIHQKELKQLQNYRVNSHHFSRVHLQHLKHN